MSRNGSGAELSRGRGGAKQWNRKTRSNTPRSRLQKRAMSTVVDLGDADALPGQCFAVDFSSVPLSLVIIAGRSRTALNLLNSLASRIPGNDGLASNARRSGVQLTIVGTRKPALTHDVRLLIGANTTLNRLSSNGQGHYHTRSSSRRIFHAGIRLLTKLACG